MAPQAADIPPANSTSAMNPATWEEMVLRNETGMISLRELGSSQYQKDLELLRTEIVNRPSDKGRAYQYILLIAALPGIWDSTTE